MAAHEIIHAHLIGNVYVIDSRVRVQSFPAFSDEIVYLTLWHYSIVGADVSNDHIMCLGLQPAHHIVSDEA
jgi:hypothetical protein